MAATHFDIACAEGSASWPQQQPASDSLVHQHDLGSSQQMQWQFEACAPEVSVVLWYPDEQQVCLPCESAHLFLVFDFELRCLQHVGTLGAHKAALGGSSVSLNSCLDLAASCLLPLLLAAEDGLQTCKPGPLVQLVDLMTSSTGRGHASQGLQERHELPASILRIGQVQHVLHPCFPLTSEHMFADTTTTLCCACNKKGASRKLLHVSGCRRQATPVQSTVRASVSRSATCTWLQRPPRTRQACSTASSSFGWRLPSTFRCQLAMKLQPLLRSCRRCVTARLTCATSAPAGYVSASRTIAVRPA